MWCCCRFFASGLYAAFSISAALRSVEHGGAGSHIDVSMLGRPFRHCCMQTSEFFAVAKDPERRLLPIDENAPIRCSARDTDPPEWLLGNDGPWKNVRATEVAKTSFSIEVRQHIEASRNQAAPRHILERIFAADDAAAWLIDSANRRSLRRNQYAPAGGCRPSSAAHGVGEPSRRRLDTNPDIGPPVGSPGSAWP